MAYAQRLAENAPLVLEMLKSFSQKALPKSPIEEMSIGLREIDLVKDSTDRIEGLASLAEKRKPKYQGK